MPSLLMKRSILFGLLLFLVSTGSSFAGSATTTTTPTTTTATTTKTTVSTATKTSSKVALTDLLGGTVKSAASTKTPVAKGVVSAMSASGSGTGLDTGIQNVGKTVMVDQRSGGAGVSVPLYIPEGRGGITPPLQLTWSPTAGDGPFGWGWSMDMGSVVRNTKNGVPKYDATDTFIATLGGKSYELVSIGNNEYRSKFDDDRMQFFFINGVWSAKGRSGTTYYFGSRPGSTVNDGGSKVFRWKLDRIEDLFRNVLVVDYGADESYEVRYGLKSGLSTLTDVNDKSNFAYVINVIAQSVNRSDVSTEYKPGFAVSKKRLVSTITIIGGGNLMKKYSFSYASSGSTNRTLLKNVSETGSDGVTAQSVVNLQYNNMETLEYSLKFINDPLQGEDQWRVVLGGNSSKYLYVNAPKKVLLYYYQDNPSVKWWIRLYLNGSEVFSKESEDRSARGSFTISLNKGYNYLDFQTGCWGNCDFGLTGFDDQVDLLTSSQVIIPQLAGDFNGDGKTDVATYFSDTSSIKVALSDGLNFLPKTTWIESFSKDKKLILGDFNADGKVDIAAYDSSARTVRVALSDGAKFTDSGIWLNNVPLGADVYAGDFNGDGRSDLYMMTRPSGWQVQLAQSTGTGFQTGDSYTPQMGSTNAAIIPGDFNGDGLTDLISFDSAMGNWEFQLNINGFGNTGIYSVGGFAEGKAPAIADFNHDGKTDIGYFDAANKTIYYWPSINGGFGVAQTLSFSFTLTDPATTQLQTADFNGDGILDYMVFNNSGKVEIALSGDTKFNDLLTSYDNNHGGKVDIEYGSSADEKNKYMPFTVPVVKKVTVSDGLGNAVASTYSYDGGYWDSAEREYYGFKETRVTDSLGNYALAQYNQDNLYMRGRIDRTAMYDKNGKILRESRSQWNNDPVIPGREDARFVTPKRVDNFVYDTPTSGLRTAQEFVFDVPLGLLNETRDLGEVDFRTGLDKGEDLVRTTMTYNNNPALGLTGFAASRSSYDKKDVLIAREWNTYDNAADYTTPVQKGLITQKKIWNVVQGSERDLVYEYTYNDYGAITKTKDPKSGTSEVIYDTTFAMFPLVKHNAKQQEAVNTFYGINGVPLTGGIWGALQSTTDINQKKGTYFYDTLGRVTSVVSPLDSTAYPTTSYEYIDQPNYRLVISHSRVEHNAPATLDSYTFYDGLGRPVAQKSPTAVSSQWAVSGHVVYNSRGEVSKKLLPYLSSKPAAELELPDPAKPGTVFEYDALGRTVKVTYPDGTYANSIYTGLSVTSYDPNGHRRMNALDARGRVTSAVEYVGADGRCPLYPNTSFMPYGVTRYVYDIQGNLVKVIDARSNVTEMVYDQLGRKVAMKDTDMGVVRYSYDDNGNLVTQTDALGQIKSFVYDDLNRVTFKSTLNAQTPVTPVTYHYDMNPNGVGRLSEVTYNADKATFSYDDLGQEIASTKTINGAAYGTGRVFDALGRMKEVTYPDAAVVKYRFNTAGQLNRVKFTRTMDVGGETWVSTKDIVTDIQYAVNGQINSKTLGNGVTITYTYDPLNFRLKELVSKNTKGETLQRLNYFYDYVGNVTKVVDGVTAITRTLRYDELNRMTYSDGREGPMYYSYDNIGNMIKKGALTYTYGTSCYKPWPASLPGTGGTTGGTTGGAADACSGPGPHAVVAISDGTNMSYDANGNMSEMQTPAEAKFFSYDTDNRLIRVEKRSKLGFATIATLFTYDGDGGRTGKTSVQNVVSPSTGMVVSTITIPTRYVGEIYEENQGGKVDYIFEGGSRLAAWDGQSMRFFLGDHLGSTNVVADDQGGIKERIEFTPWGEKSFIDTPGSQTEKAWLFFTGKMVDEETGLIYFGARYYSPKIGRFITADTIVPSPYNPQTLNRYSYCNNNPLTLVDPTGHWPKYLTKVNKILGHLMDSWGQVTGGDWSGEAYASVTVGDNSSTQNSGSTKNRSYSGSSSGNSYSGNSYSGSDGYSYSIFDPVLARLSAGPSRSLIVDLGKITVYYDKGRDRGVPPVDSLDSVQLGLDVAGMAPGIGALPDIVSGGISLFRGNYLGFGLSVLSAVPVLGDFASAGNISKRVFWSGKGAERAAMNFAKGVNATTLEMTAVGKNLIAADKMTSSFNKMAWRNASADFARGASGEVHVFHSIYGVRTASTWAETEYGILKNNRNVSRIIYHNVE
ncbi:MAG: VCBS repeat-containing protein [Candidatus Omnitrophica bacterium]|nr:VCBS repeat-containing protein [Candidatus Omnitrophota bacterium]